jgi:nickel/cobalt transporter (NicO) family protein
MSPEILLLLLFGMGNGLLHALDADHILAVSAVAMQGDNRRGRILRTAVMWALGHGGALIVLIGVALGFGLVIPEALSSAAELLVGIILISVGITLLYQLGRGRLKVTHHHHDHLPGHTHIHDDNHGRRSDHRPMLVGVVHGVAGSAPLLAILPLVIKSQFLVAGLDIFLFRVSVAVMMCVFGGLLSIVVQGLASRYRHGITVLQSLLGVQAIAFGGYWLYHAI